MTIISAVISYLKSLESYDKLASIIVKILMIIFLIFKSCIRNVYD